MGVPGVLRIPAKHIHESIVYHRWSSVALPRGHSLDDLGYFDRTPHARRKMKVAVFGSMSMPPHAEQREYVVGMD
jgi:hypothetical protein